jgi:hypothetical protein
MNFARAIHQRWAADAALCALLPAERFFTGMPPQRAAPWAVLSRLTDRPLAEFNDGATVDAVECRVELFDDDRGRLAAIVAGVRRLFDGAGFALSGNDRVIVMRRRELLTEQQSDGRWRTTIDFDCHVLRAGT